MDGRPLTWNSDISPDGRFVAVPVQPADLDTSGIPYYGTPKSHVFANAAERAGTDVMFAYLASDHAVFEIQDTCPICGRTLERDGHGTCLPCRYDEY